MRGYRFGRPDRRNQTNLGCNLAIHQRLADFTSRKSNQDNQQAECTTVILCHGAGRVVDEYARHPCLCRRKWSKQIGHRIGSSCGRDRKSLTAGVTVVPLWTGEEAFCTAETLTLIACSDCIWSRQNRCQPCVIQRHFTGEWSSNVTEKLPKCIIR
jgi:hypothetical protein